VGGSIQAVGRETGALLRLREDKTTHPPPLPVREGAVPTLRPPVGGNEESKQKVDRKSNARGRAHRLLFNHSKEHTMAFVRVEQRNARLAAGVRLDVVHSKDGLLSKGTAVAISSVKKAGEEEATAIQWTFWGKLAESAADYLGKGSRVNIVGRVQNNNYQNAEGQLVYGLTFTCEEIDYLDSRAEVEARRALQEAATPAEAPAPAPTKGPAKGVDPDDIPF
jgi:single-strand DNA-binding protein